MMTATANASIRLFLIDDHEVVRVGMRYMFQSLPGLEVSGEADSLATAVDAVCREQPDVVLLDLDLGEESGLDLIPILRQAWPEVRILVLTGLRETKLHRQAVSLGAAGLVLKGQSLQVLIQAIEHVHAGRAWLDVDLISTIITTPPPDAPSTHDLEATRMAMLTERELQVISLICEGLQNKLIAQRLSISETTVRHHLTSIFTKLSLASRLELVIYAYRHGLANLPERIVLSRAVSG